MPPKVSRRGRQGGGFWRPRISLSCTISFSPAHYLFPLSASMAALIAISIVGFDPHLGGGGDNEGGGPVSSRGARSFVTKTDKARPRPEWRVLLPAARLPRCAKWRRRKRAPPARDARGTDGLGAPPCFGRDFASGSQHRVTADGARKSTAGGCESRLRVLEIPTLPHGLDPVSAHHEDSSILRSFISKLK